MTVPTTIETVAAAVPARLGARTTPVQTGVDAIAAPVQTLCLVFVAVRIRPSGAAIEATVDAIASLVEPVFDALALAIHAPVDAVAEIIGRRRACGRQQPHA
jgi:hypothetical protein